MKRIRKCIFRNHGQDLSLEEIERFENEYSIKFPEEYKSFLLVSNGGEVEPSEFNFQNSSDGSDIQYFFSIGEVNGGLSMKEVFEMYILNKRLPEYLLPLAIDSGGNLICISSREDGTHGCVYFWDHELEGISKNIIPITYSFNAFLDSLDTF